MRASTISRSGRWVEILFQFDRATNTVYEPSIKRINPLNSRCIPFLTLVWWIEPILIRPPRPPSGLPTLAFWASKRMKYRLRIRYPEPISLQGQSAKQALACLYCQSSQLCRTTAYPRETAAGDRTRTVGFSYKEALSRIPPCCDCILTKETIVQISSPMA